LLLLREKIATINRKFYWQAREKFFVGLPEKNTFIIRHLPRVAMIINCQNQISLHFCSPLLFCGIIKYALFGGHYYFKEPRQLLFDAKKTLNLSTLYIATKTKKDC